MQSLFIVSVPLSAAAVLAWTLRLGYHKLKPLQIYDKRYSFETGQGISFHVTDDMPKVYESEGYTVLRNVLPPALVDHLLSISKSIEQERVASNRLSTVTSATNCLYSNWPENQAVQQFWFESGIAEVVAKTVGAKEMRLFEDIVIVANTKNDHMTGFHADDYSFGNVMDPKFTYSVWLPLVDITKQTGGSLQICNRSYHLKVSKNCHLGAPGNPTFLRNAARRTVPDDDKCFEQLKEVCEVPEFRAGDAIIFAKDTIHRQFEVLEPSFRRPVLIGRFVDSQATYKPRAKTYTNTYMYKVQHDMCNHGLQAGETFKGPCFPRVYPQVDATEANFEREYVHPSIVTVLATFEQWWSGAGHDSEKEGRSDKP